MSGFQVISSTYQYNYICKASIHTKVTFTFWVGLENTLPASITQRPPLPTQRTSTWLKNPKGDSSWLAIICLGWLYFCKWINGVQRVQVSISNSESKESWLPRKSLALFIDSRCKETGREKILWWGPSRQVPQARYETDVHHTIDTGVCECIYHTMDSWAQCIICPV